MMRKRRNKARDELMMVTGILIAVIAVWYFILYQPLAAKTVTIRSDMKADKDSLAAIDRYKAMSTALSQQIEVLDKQIGEWDVMFPPRSGLVEVARRLIAFCEENGIQLVEMHPSLFELYALEQAGNTVAGKYVFKQLFNLKLRGNYINTGRMLERVKNLPFRMTVSDVRMSVAPENRPQLDIEIDMFIYVHR
jgi:Tfp pilus assembly protein PilO